MDMQGGLVMNIVGRLMFSAPLVVATLVGCGSDSGTVAKTETLTVPTDGSAVSSLETYAATTTVTIEVSGVVKWGGCDATSCPDGASCGYDRQGDALFHSDNCFTGASPTATSFSFPVQLYLDGAALPAAAFAASHVYTFAVAGNGGPFAFAYHDVPGSFADNSGSFTVKLTPR
jgi:hypothetical protein